MLRDFPIRLFAYYYRVHLQYNLVFSALAFVLTGFNYRGFVFTFVSMGFVVAMLLYYLWREPEYYFFYNRGLSKIQLYGFTYLLDLLLAITLWFFFKKVGLW